MKQSNPKANSHVPSRRALLLGASAALFAGGRALSQPAPVPGAANAPKVSLRFATSYAGVHPMAKPVRERLAQFTADYPNVTIVTEESPGDSQLTKIKLDASADRLPDLFNYWRLDPSFGLDQVARSGRLADLTDWVKTDPVYKGLFDQASWDTATLDGKIYGIPALMYYVEFLANKLVFDRAGVALPEDWASLQSAVKALKAKGEIPWAISIGNDSEGGRLYNAIVNDVVGNKRALQMHSGKEPIDVPDMVHAFELLQDLVTGNIPDDAIAISNDAVYAKYVNRNRGALIMDGSWVTATIKPEVQKNLTVLSFPTIPGGQQTVPHAERDLTSLWYLSAATMANAVKRPYVMELARRLSSGAAEKFYAEQAGLAVPAIGLTIDESKYGRLAFEAQTLSLKTPVNKWIPSVMTPVQRSQFEPALSEFLAGRQKPAAFATKLGTIFAAT